MSVATFDKLAKRWQHEARDDHRAADRLGGIEQKLARTRANTREAMANELMRIVERTKQKDERRDG